MIAYIFSLFEGNNRRKLHIYILTSVISPLVDIFSLSMILVIMNNVAKEGVITTRNLCITFGMMAVTVLKAIFELYRAEISNRLIYSGTLDISKKMYDLIMSESLIHHSEKTPMQAITQVREDASSCVTIMVNIIGMAVGAVTVVGYAVIFVWYAKLIGILVFLVLLAFMSYVYLLNRKRILKYGERRRLLSIKNNAQISTAFGAFKEMKIDNRSDYLLEKFTKTGEELADIQAMFSFKSSIAGVALREGTMMFLFLFLGIIMVAVPDIAQMMASLVVYVGVLIKMVPSMQKIVASQNSIDYARHSYEMLKDNMNRYRELVCERNNEEQTEFHDASFNDGLFVRGLTFGYSDKKKIFENADIDVPAGSCVGIIGASGAGKTTFLDLILGLLRAESGSVKYDDYDLISGCDEKGKCKVNLGDIVSYIPQVVYLNGETVKHNVAFFEDDEFIDKEKVVECLKCAQIYQDIIEMPKGIDTLIGENGTTISGGQRQRIALARALYKDFELLIMDEATAALDMETEKAVIDSIRQIKGDKTLLMVTHHMSLADECDIVYRIENKKFVRVR